MIGTRLQIAIGLLLCAVGVCSGYITDMGYGSAYNTNGSFLLIVGFLGIVYGAMLDAHSKELAFELTVCIGMGIAIGIGAAFPHKRLGFGLALTGTYYAFALLVIGMKYAKRKWWFRK